MKRIAAALLMASLATTVAGCSKDDNSTDSASSSGASPSGDQALVERMSQATLAWTITKDGKTELAVHSPTCQPLKDVSGTLRFHRTSDGKTEKVPLEAGSSSGLLVADGPDLDPELTEVRYELKVAGEPLTGSLHVPNDGTSGLVAASADNSKAAKSAADAAPKGPHGGTVDTVGDSKLEVVADTETGVVRVYPLTSTLEPSDQPVGQLRLAVGGSKPQVVKLARTGEPPDVHYAGLIDPGAAGRKLTILVKRPDAKIRVAILGLRRGHALYVGRDAPRRRYWLRKGWSDQAAELRSGPGAPGTPPGDEPGDEPGDDPGGKVTICHVPPGNPANQHTITVGASAVAAHLKHGDYRGACRDDAVSGSGSKGKSKGKGKGKGKGKKK